MAGIFTISLDFELHWGGFEKWSLPAYNQYFLNTRAVIPRMLELFSQHDIHVTWATVGLLLHESREQMENNFPSVKPSYLHPELSAFHFINHHGIGRNESEDPYHYAHSLVQLIVNTPHQELGSHTFSHYYCNEEGSTVESFRADLRSAIKATSRYGIRPRSLVFPRNQFNEEHLRVCAEEGFICVRSNPSSWFWQIHTRKEGMWKRFNRGLDAYFPMTSNNSYPLSRIRIEKDLPLCLPASRLLRPYRPNELFLNNLKISRIINEMEKAAMHNEAYHLWWHPHNFGNYPVESLAGLEKILKAFCSFRSRYGMRSLNMGELADHILSRNGGSVA